MGHKCPKCSCRCNFVRTFDVYMKVDRKDSFVVAEEFRCPDCGLVFYLLDFSELY